MLEQSHGSVLQFNTEHVILAGFLDTKILCDDIAQNNLVIEIHDRDYKYIKEDALKYSSKIFDLNLDFLEGGVIQNNLNPINSYGQAMFGIFSPLTIRSSTAFTRSYRS